VTKGCLITFEGIEACGKSTQINLLYNYLKKNNVKCIKTREPGGTKLAEKIRSLIIRDLKNNEDILTELLLLFAARSNHFKKIKSYLNKGYIVLCDRYIDSTYAYQYYEQGQSLKFINSIQKKIDEGLSPKITFLLDIPPKISKQRINLRKKIDRFDMYNINKLSKLRKSFDKLSKKHKRIFKINGLNSTASIKDEIIKYLNKKNVIKNFR